MILNLAESLLKFELLDHFDASASRSKQYVNHITIFVAFFVSRFERIVDFLCSEGSNSTLSIDKSASLGDLKSAIEQQCNVAAYKQKCK
jgi:hypothetical protein